MLPPVCQELQGTEGSVRVDVRSCPLVVTHSSMAPNLSRAFGRGGSSRRVEEIAGQGLFGSLDQARLVLSLLRSCHRRTPSKARSPSYFVKRCAVWGTPTC